MTFLSRCACQVIRLLKVAVFGAAGYLIYTAVAPDKNKHGQNRFLAGDSFAIPMTAVTGIGLAQDGETIKLVALGDAKPRIAKIDFTSEHAMRDIEYIDLDRLIPPGLTNPTQDQPAFSGLAREPSGHWLVSTRGAILRFDSEFSSSPVVSTFAEPSALAASGLILRGKNHLLIVTTLSPPTVVELGSKGSSALGFDHRNASVNEGFELPADLVELHRWSWIQGQSCDLSDGVVAAGSKLILLSRSCRKLLVVDALDPGSTAFRPELTLPLPSNLGAPEALAALADGQLIVGTDLESTKRNLNFIHSRSK